MRLSDIRHMDTGRAMRTVMCAFTISFFIAALCAPDRGSMMSGLLCIVSQPAQLTRDCFKPELGGISATMLNYALTGSVCCALMFLPEVRITGVTVLGYFLTVSFCGYGINIVNILPMILGVYVYSLLRRQPFGRNVNFAMFSTALSPLISEALFRYPSASQCHGITPAGVALAVLIGLITGCAMPALCAHSPFFHKGYDLYNAGPAAGLLCFMFFAILYRTPGIEAPAIGAQLGEGDTLFVNVFCGIMFTLCLICGVALNGGLGDYGKLLKDTGYRSDFTAKYSTGSVLMNLGVYGLFILLYYDLIGATFTGATLGAVFGMMSCCCAGATPLNVFPIMIGYGVMGLLYRVGATAFPINAQSIVVGLCFASGLAPIPGEYGIPAGIVAGMLHYCLVTSVPAIHGGFNLYNGGFTAGIVCFLCVPLLEHYFRKKRKGSPDE